MGAGKSQEIRDALLGQHLPLVVAAHLARVQLVADPLARYDSEHMAGGALKDGRMLSSVSIRRGDLRQAIALLRSVGVPGLERREPERVVARSRDQLQILARIEALVREPAAPGQVSALLVALARQVREDRVLTLAIELITALHHSNDDLARLTLAQLRTVLHAEAERAKEA